MTFVQDCLAGLATSDDIDGYVERWHEGGSILSLIDFLGLTDREYAMWIFSHSSLQDTLEDHRKIAARDTHISADIQAAESTRKWRLSENEVSDLLSCTVDIVAGLAESLSITPATAELASLAWRSIWKASNYKLSFPSICTNIDGKVFYSWSNDRYHLDLDIVPDEVATFFFCDKQTDLYWCEDYTIGSVVPLSIATNLRYF